MTELDDKKTAFEKRLAERRQAHQEKTSLERQAIREQLLRDAPRARPEEVARRLASLDADLSAARPARGVSLPGTRVPLRVDLAGSAPLRELDVAFQQQFQIGTVFPQNRLDYPTVYCETPEEFFTPLIEDLNISPEARKAELDSLIDEARQMADQTQGGGIFGVNIPGRGCYLNGWLFAWGKGIPPREALQQPDLLRRILATAAHEKLGHGFLSVYSALGAVKTRLGLTLLETAQRFGLRPADDPQASLRQKQANLLFTFSQLLEEGWATWIENYLQSALLELQSERYTLKRILDALNKLPPDMEGRKEVLQTLAAALEILFGEQQLPAPAVLQAVLAVELLGSNLDDFFMHALGQPLRYAVGDLLCQQAALRLGELCVPYAALIAANVTLDPGQISLGDLERLLSSDWRLNPDARLAMLSRAALPEKNSLPALAHLAESALSLSVPVELKR